MIADEGRTMDNETSVYNIAAIRRLLLTAFTAKDLRRFCWDRPILRPVITSFGPDHGLDDMVDRVIDYCETRPLWREFLKAVKGGKATSVRSIPDRSTYVGRRATHES